jgi:hypothetical protein
MWAGPARRERVELDFEGAWTPAVETAAVKAQQKPPPVKFVPPTGDITQQVAAAVATLGPCTALNIVTYTGLGYYSVRNGLHRCLRRGLIQAASRSMIRQGRSLTVYRTCG